MSTHEVNTAGSTGTLMTTLADTYFVYRVFSGRNRVRRRQQRYRLVSEEMAVEGDVTDESKAFRKEFNWCL